MCMEIEDWTFLLFNFNGQIWGGDMNLADVEMFVNCWFAHRNDGIKPDFKKGVCKYCASSFMCCLLLRFCIFTFNSTHITFTITICKENASRD